jgi:cell division protein YceG involved in septum cleavage
MKKRWLLLLVVVIVSAWAWHSLAPVDSGDSEEIVVPIAFGESLGKIAASLQSRGLIRSAFTFKVYAKLKGLASSLQAYSSDSNHTKWC